MFAVGNNELAAAPDLGDTVMCPRCFVEHKIETSLGDAEKDPTRLHFYKCHGTSYLAGINGKSMMERFSKPKEK